MPIVHHGALTRSGLLTLKGDQWDLTRFSPTKSLYWLCEQAQAHHLSHLWVMQDCEMLPDQAFFEAGCEKWNLVATWKDLKELSIPGHVNELVAATGWRKTERGDFQKARTICFPYNSKWHFCKDPQLGAKQLLITIDYLQRAFDVTVGASPGTVGMKLIEKVNSHHPQWLQIPEIDLVKEAHFDRSSAQDLIWQRPLHHDEMHMKYLHKYDKNSAYLRACVNEMFGYGTPVHVEGATEFDKRAPGVWRVRVKEPVLQDLPPVMWDRASWVATPIVKLLRDTGHTIKIYEGWMFKEYHGTLKKWAETLWTQRQDFRNNVEAWKHPICREYARSATKDIAVATIGLSSFNFAEKTFKARPDWRTQVVAGTRATMFYNMLKVQRETSRTPVLVYLDALYYLSNEPDPAKAIPLLDKTDSLGGYKNDGWSLEVDQTVLNILTSDDPSNQRLQQLNALLKERTHAGK
jgi:hypothetical protein